MGSAKGRSQLPTLDLNGLTHLKSQLILQRTAANLRMDHTEAFAAIIAERHLTRATIVSCASIRKCDGIALPGGEGIDDLGGIGVGEVAFAREVGSIG